ncbi:hypothetical protein ACLBXM_15845 [Xanthobacteraceae bacterium A53D]
MPGLNARAAGLGLRVAGLATLILAGTAGSALALLPPQFYEQARASAPNVVVVKVASVRAPADPRGTCAVKSKVLKVERGTLYKAGQTVTIGVPCVNPGAPPLVGGTIYAEPAALRAAGFGRAYLDASGTLMQSQYHLLDKAP